MLSDQPERREALPSLLGLPAHLLRRLSPRGRWLVLAATMALIGLAVTLGTTLVPTLRAEREAQEAVEARRAAAERSTLVARLDREAQALTGVGPAARDVAPSRAVPTRRRLLRRLEAAVVADARRRSRRGELDAVYKSAACFEFPKRLTDRRPEQLTERRVMRMECIAVSTTIEPGERTTGSLIGQPFRARVDFDRGRYAWCKIVQRPGELSIQQALIRVPRACRG